MQNHSSVPRCSVDARERKGGIQFDARQDVLSSSVQYQVVKITLEYSNIIMKCVGVSYLDYEVIKHRIAIRSSPGLRPDQVLSIFIRAATC